MSSKNNPNKYTEEFKKTIVSLYQSGKTYAQIQKEYGRIVVGSVQLGKEIFSSKGG